MEPPPPYNANYAPPAPGPGYPPAGAAPYPPAPYPPSGGPAPYPPAGAPGPYPPPGAAPPFNMPPGPAGAPPFAPGPYPPPAGQAPPLVAPQTMVNMGPIYNPPMPLITTLPRPMKDGQTIHITGSIPPNPKRFHINLSLGGAQNQKVGTALHINPRWDEKPPLVVRNSYLKNKWGNEERWGEFFPLTAGGNFECLILVQSDCYKVAFNGHHFCEFKHRTSKDQVSHLVVEGDVTVNCVWAQPAAGAPAGSVPAAFPPPMQYPAGAPQPAEPVKLPCKREIPGALYAGRMIYISGTPKSPSYERFHINLGYEPKMNRDIAFHFCPRYKEKVVVRNTMPGFSWGREERSQPLFPFHPGKPFDIIILVEKDQFKVAVDGQHFITYQHRLRNLGHIKHIEIRGDVTISNLRM